MADDTQQQQPQAPPDLNAAIQALIQQQIAAASGQGNQVQLPSTQPPPSQYSNDPSKGPGLLARIGLALGGGSLPGAPAELRAQMGAQALMNFGTGLMSAGRFSTPGEVLAGGFRGAQSGLLGSEAAQAGQQEYALNAQTKLAELGMEQQKNRTAALTALVPLLQMQGRLGLPPLFGPGSAAGGGGGGGGGGYTGDTYEGAIGSHEGTGQNPNSSAFGPGQFLAGTWNQFAAANPDLFKGMSPDQILAARANPQLANQAITWLAQKNAQTLQAQGVRPTGQSLGIAHYLGAGGAAAVIGAPDSDPVSKYVSDAAVKANPELATMTVGQMKARYANTPNPGFLTAAGGGPPASGPRSAVGPYKPPGAATAPETPPGVQMGGPPPAPPGAAPGAPEAGGGIGLALNPPTGRDAATVAPPPVVHQAPIPGKPGGDAASRRSAAADAIVQGMQTAQAEPAPPGTALAAGPAAGTPPAAQAAPVPEPGWGAQVGSYDTGAPVGPVRPPAAATAQPPATQPPSSVAQPPPAQPPAPVPAPASRAHDYSVADTELNPEEYQDRHFVPLTADQVKTYAPGPAGDLAASAADQVQRERDNLRVQQTQLERMNRGAIPADAAAVARQDGQVTDAQKALDAAENSYNDQVQKLAQSGASNLLNRDNAERARVSADYKASVVDPRNAAALATQQGKQAIQLEQAKGQTASEQKVLDTLNETQTAAQQAIDQTNLARSLSRASGDPGFWQMMQSSHPETIKWLANAGQLPQEVVQQLGTANAADAAFNKLITMARFGTGFSRPTNLDVQILTSQAPQGTDPQAWREAKLAYMQTFMERENNYVNKVYSYHSQPGVSLHQAQVSARNDMQDIVPQMDAKTAADPAARTQWAATYVPANTFFRAPDGRLLIYPGAGAAQQQQPQQPRQPPGPTVGYGNQ
jgi:hypothetical protein